MKFGSMAGLITAGLLIILLIVAVLGYIVTSSTLAQTSPDIIIGLVVVLSACVLVFLLFIMAAGFKVLGLNDPEQAVGLPKGTVSAMIALLLIIVWVIVSVYVFFTLPGLTKSSVGAGTTSTTTTTSNGNTVTTVAPDMTVVADTVKLAQQLYTTMSTLVVAIAAFYFGSSSVRAAQSALSQASGQPSITSITPKKGNQGQANLPLTIIGKNLGSPKSVRLTLDKETPIVATDLSYTQTDVSMIECTISLANNPKLGQWDVIVVNYDGNECKLEKAFEVIKAQPPTPPVPTVTGINPTSGLAAGGTPVIITGSSFTGASTVSFGSTPASNFTVDSDTQIKTVSPAGTGTVHVTVTTPGGISATNAADQFTYQ